MKLMSAEFYVLLYTLTIAFYRNQYLQKHYYLPYFKLNSAQFSAVTIFIKVFVCHMIISIILYKFFRIFCSDGFNNFSSWSQNFLQAKLLSGNLVPRFHHFLHLWSNVYFALGSLLQTDLLLLLLGSIGCHWSKPIVS